MTTQLPIVRAIDVGYGHTKFTDGRNADGTIIADSFPSQSPLAPEEELSVGVMQRRETFRVPIDDRIYEVGKGVSQALHSSHESAILDHDYALSAPYAARLYGALNYMRPNLPGHCIDFLILGLPLNTYRTQRRFDVAKRFTGELTINTKGDKVLVRRCEVFPQPLGSYLMFLNANAQAIKALKTPPEVLVLDPGYNTFDWFVCQGMSANESSNAVTRGMSAVIKLIAERIIRGQKSDASVTEVIRLIDRSLSTGEELTLYGHPVELDKYIDAGRPVTEEAAQAVKNAIGAGASIKAIVLTGGGARFYLDAVKDKFPRHRVEILEEPALANVRGFHSAGDDLAKSAQRAMAGVK